MRSSSSGIRSRCRSWNRSSTTCSRSTRNRSPAAIEEFAQQFRRALGRGAVGALGEPTSPRRPRASRAEARLKAARQELLEDCDGFFARAAIAASLTSDERREILRGMVLTRAIDNRLKQFFIGSEIQFDGVPFQGKGFRSLGQEAIYAAAIRLRRGAAWRDRQRGWQGDVVGPIIRDLGVALAMRPEPAAVRMVLNAQMAKDGPPMGGKDLHIGDWEWGILPATAPLSISTMSIAGIALAFAREGSQRVAVSFIGDGGSSLGEWHEAINLCAAGRLPAIFCIENNQIALSTPVHAQSAARVFADKARGYGIPGITIDGTDPEEVAAAFAWAAERGRARSRSDAHRARDHADGRARASRRHAVSGEGTGAGRGHTRTAGAWRLCRPRGVRTLDAEGPHRVVRRAAGIRRR